MKNLNFAEVMILFNKIWRADRRRYIAAGMSEFAIQGMYELHVEQFNSERRWKTHTQSLDGAVFTDGDSADEDQSPLLDKFWRQLSNCQSEISEWGRYDWVDDLDTPELARYIKSLSEKNLELLTSMVVDKMNRANLSRAMGVSRAAITKRMKPIEKVLEDIFPDRLTNELSQGFTP